MNRPEFALTCAVAEYLAYALPADVLWSHLPFGEVRPKATAGRLKAMGVNPGWPDFLILGRVSPIGTPGYGLPYVGPIFIEIKTAQGRLSKAQATWHEAAKALGYNVHVARSVEEVEGILRGHGLAPRARVA